MANRGPGVSARRATRKAARVFLSTTKTATSASSTSTATTPNASIVTTTSKPCLVQICSDDDLEHAFASIAGLLKRQPALSARESAYLGTLVEAVENYEDTHYPVPLASQASVLQHLMEAKEISQVQLASVVGIPPSVIAAGLAGTRRLSQRAVNKLADYFGVGPATFLSSEQSHEARSFLASSMQGSRSALVEWVAFGITPESNYFWNSTSSGILATMRFSR